MADGQDRLEARAQAWADRQAGSFADRPKRTLAKWLGGLLVLIVVFAIGFGALSWVLSWGGEAKRVTGVENVREQYATVIEDWQAMQAAAENACQAASATQSQGDPTIIEAPSLAYDAQYRRIAVDFNRRQANLFEARLVGPKGYPRTAPTLAVMQARVCK